MAKFEVEGEQLIEKAVGKHGTGAVVYCPRKWRGRKVYVILRGK